MNRPAFARVKQVYLRVRGAPPATRALLLARECGGDAALAAEVESLLATDAAADGFLAEPVLGAGFSVAEAMARHDASFRAGDYRAVTMIGAGATGLVYRAVHEPSGREVALKVLRPGALTPDGARRLLDEAALLRRLDHPAIAQVHDAGTAELHGESTAFVAMELVDGLTLDQFVQGENCTVRAIVHLVATIADAVQHAHERGIVHNDLKPSNVLVTADGTPRIVDFGVAQCCDTPATTQGGTLDYLAPERLLPTPPRSSPAGDVYALGVIAYELLTGRRPHDFDRAGATAPAGDREPWPLGALRPELRGDLETIVHHAIDPKPSCRCRSAAFLARDLRRWLAGEAIASPRLSWPRRLRRFARHHRAVVGGIAASFLALLLGLVGTLAALRSARTAWQHEATSRATAERLLLETDAARAAADRAARRASAVGDYLCSVLRSATPSGAEGNPDLEQVLVAAAESMPQTLVDADGTTSATCHALGLSLFAVGRYDLAVRQLEHALELATDADDRFGMRLDLGIATLHSGRAAAAERQLAALSAEVDAVPAATAALRLRCRYSHALAAYEAGQVRLARDLVDRALATTGDPPAGDRSLLGLRGLAGLCASALDEHAESAAIYAACVADAELLLGAEHPQTLTFLNNLALERLQLDDTTGCEQLLQRALAGRQRLYGESHPDTLQTLHNLASLRGHQQRYAEAIELQRTVLAERVRRLGAGHPKTLTTHNNLARLLERAGRADEAERCFRELLDHATANLPPEHWHLIVFRRNLAQLLHRQQRDAEALPLLEAGLDHLTETLGADHDLVEQFHELHLAVRRAAAPPRPR